MNQDHAANVAAKVPPGVPPGDWRRTALEPAPGHSHGARSAPWEWPGPGGVDGRRQKCGGTARGPEKKRQVFSGFVPPRAGPRQGQRSAILSVVFITLKQWVSAVSER